MAKISPGRAVVETLVAEGVPFVFGIVGSSYVEAADAFYGRDDIKFISTRHEQGAAFMAVGYARVTGKPGVCMATNGPGTTNLLTGIAEAALGFTPVVAITGAAMRDHYHRGAFQELDHISIFRPVTKLAMLVPKADRIPELLDQAFRVATSGQQGPVLVDIYRDMYQEPEFEADLGRRRTLPRQRQGGDPAQVGRAARLLREARFPVVVAGAGVKWSETTQEAVRLAEFLGAPMVTSYGHNDAVPNDHPLYVGALGRAGSAEAQEATRRADVVLALGSRLGHFTTFYTDQYITPETRIIQVDVEPREIGRSFPVEVGIVGDAQRVALDLMEALEEMGPPAGREERMAAARELREKKRQRLEAEATLPSKPVKPQRVYHEMKKVAPRDTIWVLDANATAGYGHDRLEFSSPRTMVASLDLGCVGSAFPMAVGAKMGRPDRPVVCLIGDGGFLFNSQELETAMREHIPLVTVVMNNNCWGAEKAYQKWIFNERYVGSDLTNPRLDLYAQSFGAKGITVDRAEDVEPALEECLKADLPSVLEVLVDPDEIPFPARAADQYKGWKPPQS